MSDSTTRRCQVLTIRGLYFLLGHTGAALAIAVHIGTHGAQPGAAQPDALCPLTTHSLASRSNGAQS